MSPQIPAISHPVRYLKMPDTQSDSGATVTASVTSILSAVHKSGDEALTRLSNELDGVDITTFEIARSDIDAAIAGLDPVTREDSGFAIDNVRRFARAQLETLAPLECEPLPGVHLGHRIIPIQRIGCYVPGGRYPLLSAPVMSIVPGKVAGCESVVACLPPGASEATIAICGLAGADRIYRVGGAQAIAAMAYGTETLDPVDKIVGPGNRFVNEAKRQVFGDVGIDSLAGPSEIFILADDSAKASIVAADLLGQAEHDPATRVGVATTSEELAHEVGNEIERQLSLLAKPQVADEAWRANGIIVICESEDALVEYANAMASEHLQIHTHTPHEIGSRIRNYGSLFIGENASVVYSDKCCGTNHTLPTLGSARYVGGLWVGTYLKTCTHQWIDSSAISTVAAPAIRQSMTEGMEAHARAAAARLPENEANELLGGHTARE